jgi:hypothetical protein
MNRVEFIKALNEIVLGLGDEELIEGWLMNGVPDCPSEEDFEFIANDQESFDETVNCFVRLSKYIKTGIKINGKWYKG